MFFNFGGELLRLEGLYTNQCAFVISVSAPLSEKIKLPLERRGILVVAINESANYIRPDIWILTKAVSTEAAIANDPGVLQFVTKHLDLKHEECRSYFQYENEHAALNKELFPSKLESCLLGTQDQISIESLSSAISLLKDLGVTRMFLITDTNPNAVDVPDEPLSAGLEAIKQGNRDEREILCIDLVEDDSPGPQTMALTNAVDYATGTQFDGMDTRGMYDRLQRLKDSLKPARSRNAPSPVKVRKNPVIGMKG